MDIGNLFLLSVVILALAILNIILFIKIWKMTNDVSRISDNIERLADKFAPKDPVKNKENNTKDDNPFRGNPFFAKD